MGGLPSSSASVAPAAAPTTRKTGKKKPEDGQRCKEAKLVAKLVSMGFDKDQAAAALRRQGDVEKAVASLVATARGKQGPALAIKSAATKDQALEEARTPKEVKPAAPEEARTPKEVKPTASEEATTPKEVKPATAASKEAKAPKEVKPATAASEEAKAPKEVKPATAASEEAKAPKEVKPAAEEQKKKEKKQAKEKKDKKDKKVKKKQQE